MNIGYLRLDHGEWGNGSYNSQEVGLAKAFEKMGHNVTIFYCVFPHDEKAGVTVEISKNIKKSYLTSKKIGHHALLNMKQLDKYELDLLHIQGDNLLKVPDAVSYCKKRGIRYYCYVGRIDSEKTGKLHRLLADIMVQRNIFTYRHNPVFVKTPTVKQKLECYGIKNTIVAPVGLDLSIIPTVTGDKNEIRAKLELPNKKRIILCVSRLVDGKQPYDIFKLARLLDESYYFVFIGGWDKVAEDAFCNKIKKENLQNRFRYINKLPNSEMHEYFKSVDFLVNFNQHEIFGMAILEAMYQGLTVVARRAPGPEFIINNGESGYIVDTLEEMAQVIQNDVQIGEEARNRVIHYFNWDNAARILLGEK